MRQTFDLQLQHLQEDIVSLASMVADALVRSVDQLKQRDQVGARLLIAQDRAVNEKRFEIEDQVLTLIATQQPMARDMRLLGAALEIATELERMGDYAKGIARINLMIGEQPLMMPVVDLVTMAAKASEMLRKAMQAFAAGDVALARSIPPQDDEVDRLYEHVYRELVSYILQDRSTIEQANLLMWAGHNLERTADRVINLCERVVFMETGQLEELNSDMVGMGSI